MTAEGAVVKDPRQVLKEAAGRLLVLAGRLAVAQEPTLADIIDARRSLREEARTLYAAAEELGNNV